MPTWIEAQLNIWFSFRTEDGENVKIHFRKTESTYLIKSECVGGFSIEQLIDGKHYVVIKI